MKYSEFLLVDLENIHVLNLTNLKNDIKVFIFVGIHQKKIPFDLVTSAQQLGESLKWVRITGQGKNALDFHIAFYLGELNQSTEKSVKFTVLSKDAGYDPLVNHLIQLGRRCKRINSLREADINSANLDDPNTQRILDNLQKIENHKRPRTRNTLEKHITTILRGKASSDEIDSVIDNLFIRDKLSERNGRLIYQL